MYTLTFMNAYIRTYIHAYIQSVGVRFGEMYVHITRKPPGRQSLKYAES